MFFEMLFELSAFPVFGYRRPMLLQELHLLDSTLQNRPARAVGSGGGSGGKILSFPWPWEFNYTNLRKKK
jgi:hypothetical protein